MWALIRWMLVLYEYEYLRKIYYLFEHFKYQKLVYYSATFVTNIKYGIYFVPIINLTANKIKYVGLCAG